MEKLFVEFGQIAVLTRDVARAVFRRPFEGRLIVDAMYELGVQSLPLVLLTTGFTGAVMALQVSFTLAAYGAQLYVGSFVGMSMVKELGPVLTAVMLAARVGAGMTAELGSMAVSEQVDAVRALGADPVKKLVMPRMVAMLLMVPVLTMIGIAIGILGGMYIGVVEIGQSSDYYWSKVFEYMKIGDMLSGVGKTFFFAYFIGIIACNQGLNTRGGAAGVGISTTRSVVLACVSIFVSNFFLAKALLFVQSLVGRWVP